MRLAYSSLGAPTWDPDRLAGALVEAGYQGVELRIVRDQVIDPAAYDRAARRALRRAFHRQGLDIVCLGASSRFALPKVEERRAQEAALLAYLELAVDLDCPLVRTFGGQVPEGCTPAQAVRWVAESLNRVAPRAEALGVQVVLETHDGFSRAAAVMEALALVESPAVGVLWDTLHPYRMGESVGEVLDLVGGRLLHVHVKDGRRRPDGGWDLVLLGEGEVPVREAVQALQAAGYTGWLSVEWEKKWHPAIPEPEVAIPQHARVLRQYLAGLPA